MNAGNTVYKDRCFIIHNSSFIISLFHDPPLVQLRVVNSGVVDVFFVGFGEGMIPGKITFCDKIQVIVVFMIQNRIDRTQRRQVDWPRWQSFKAVGIVR